MGQTTPALLIQWAGIGLITTLFFALSRAIRREDLRQWTLAWECLTISLTALVASFPIPQIRPVLLPIYLLGEYAFGFFLWAGCRVVAGKRPPGWRAILLLVPAIAVAVVLSRQWLDFNHVFLLHAAAVASILWVALVVLLRRPERSVIGLGFRLTAAGLMLLAIAFTHYVPVFALSLARGGGHGYLAYSSVYDLLVELVLAFGMVVFVMESVLGEAQRATAELRIAHDRLEEIARADPLTSTLNRHAFYTLLEEDRLKPAQARSGSVAVADIDNLKIINDTHGHATGDLAIREMASLLRRHIRADDLLFRWGGDEFLVLLFGMSVTEARRRLGPANGVAVPLPSTRLKSTLTISISCGFSAFDAGCPLESAIAKADTEMYAIKQSKSRVHP